MEPDVRPPLPTTAAELLERYAAGERDFSSPEHIGEFSRPNVKCTNLRGACLEAAVLKGAELVGADLAGANLSFVILEGANLRRADLRRANLAAANLKDAILKDAILEGADMVGANLTHARLTRANLAGANLEGADLAGAIWHDAIWHGANLAGANLAGAKLKNAKLKDGNLTGADLKDANLAGANQTDANLAGANLTDADLTDAKLAGANLKDAKLAGALLLHAKGLRVDHTFVRGAQFAPASSWIASPDDWTQLRQKYTGTAMMFNLILLFAFLVPLVARALFWTGVNETQDRVAAWIDPMRQDLDQAVFAASQVGTDPRISKFVDQAHKVLQNGNWTRCLHEDCKQRSVAAVVLRTDKGAVGWGLALLLLIYNIGRAVLTKFVGPLREQEERSGWTPERDWKFRALVWLHYRVWALGWVALAAFVFHGYHWLSATVSVPF